MVTRAICIGTSVGIASAAHTTSAAGAEPCCICESQGPAASGLVTTRLPSTRKIGSIKRLSEGTLFCAEHSVAGIAETRQDVAVIVQPFVDGGSPDRNVGMLCLELYDPFRCSKQTDEPDLAGAARLQERGRGTGGITGRQHGIHQDHHAVRQILRRLEKIFD